MRSNNCCRVGSADYVTWLGVFVVRRIGTVLPTVLEKHEIRFHMHCVCTVDFCEFETMQEASWGFSRVFCKAFGDLSGGVWGRLGASQG